MNGVVMLRAIRQACPDTVRALLTGHAELAVAMQAVNEGHIFGLHTKPCDPETLELVLVDAFRHHELVTEKPLKGSVAVLCDLALLVKSIVFGRISRICRISRILPNIRGLPHRLGAPRPWKTETAAMLSVLGFITLPDSLIAKEQKGRPPDGGRNAAVPGPSSLRRQACGQDSAHGARGGHCGLPGEGSGAPRDDYRGAVIPLGARILKAVLDFDILLANGMPTAGVITRLHHRKGVYAPRVVAAPAGFAEQSRYALQKAHLHALEPGMILAEDLVGISGGEPLLLMAKGREFNEVIIEYPLASSRSIQIKQPVAVVQPV